MERAKPYLKAAALTSAILLVGAFVFYRGGSGFMGGSKSNPAFQVIARPTPEPQAPDYMGGSKSTFIFVGDGVKPPTEPTPAEPKTPVTPVPAKPDE